jgi:Ulp1 family protease
MSKNEFTLSSRVKTETFKVGSDDLEKLRPDTDLNDIIVGYYIKIFNFAFLPPVLEERSYFFNSYLIEKLIDRYTSDDVVSEIESK